MKQNNTISTVSSSSLPSTSPFSRHPHDTFPFDNNDVYSTNEEDDIIVMDVEGCGRYDDPDRLRQILVMNHESELGEI